MRHENQPINTIAVLVGLDLVGDALIKLPFVRALRAAYPEAEISWLTTKGKSAYGTFMKPLVAPYLNHVDMLPKPAPHYDLVIDTRNRWKLAREARSTIPHNIFIAPAMRFLFSDRKPRQFWKKHPHIQDRLMQMLELAAGAIPKITGGITLDPIGQEKAKAILPDGKTYIGLVPGAGNRVKVWPRDRFIAVARAQATRGHIPVFLLGPDETEWLQPLAEQVPEALFPLQHDVWDGKYSLDATMAIGERLACCVTNDNGTSHMLAAVDCPLVSLFGPTSADKLAPKVSRRQIITAQKFGSSAMTAIPVEAVNAAIDTLVTGQGL